MRALIVDITGVLHRREFILHLGSVETVANVLVFIEL